MRVAAVSGCLLAMLATCVSARAAEGFGQIPGPGGCLLESGQPATSACGAGTGIADPRAIAVSPDGTSVYVVGGLAADNVAQSFGVIAILKRDPATGELSDVGCLSSDGTDGREGASGICTPMPSLLGADGVTVSPDGHTVYVTASSSGSVVAFAREAATGALTRLGCFAATPRAGSPCTPANLFPGSDDPLTSATGAALYMASPLEGAISALIAPAPSKSGEEASALPSLASLFTATPQSFFSNPCIAVNGYDGECAVGVAMKTAHALTLSPEGAQLYAAAPSSKAIDVFSVASSGALTQSSCMLPQAPPGICTSSKFLVSPSELAVSPDGRNLYAADRGPDGGRIDVLARNPTSGALSDGSCLDYQPPPPKPPSKAEMEEEKEAEEEGGESEKESGQEEAKEPAGPCAPVAGIESVAMLAVGASGAQVYAFGANSAASFSRDASTGALNETSCAAESDERCASVPDLSKVEAAAVSPDGRDVYVVTANSQAVIAFGIGAAVTSSSAHASRRGLAFVSVACPARLHASCHGRLILTRSERSRVRHHARARAHVTRLPAGGSSPFSIAPGTRARLAVRLLPSTLALLRARSRLDVTAMLRSSLRSGGGGFGHTLLLRLARPG